MKRFLFAGLLLSCASPPRPAPVVAKKPSVVVAPEKPRRPTCPFAKASPDDVRALLKNHARAYGSPTAVTATLPRTMSGELTTQGKTGKFELILDKARHRSSTEIAGMTVASGIDEKGAWELGISGALLRLDPEEAKGALFERWLSRRLYVEQFVGERDSAVCAQDPSGPPRVTLRMHVADVGDPTLVFDLTTAELVSYTRDEADGRRVQTTVDSWSPMTDGVRWPVERTERPLVAAPVKTRLVENAPGAHCAAGGDCLAPPIPAFAYVWPAPQVKVPMSFYLGEVVLKVKLGEREVWALLDSGAGLTALDTTTPAGEAFTPSMEVDGASATQKLHMGLGQIDSVKLGPLAITHLPVVSVPIQALESFGPKRPEVILGFSLFAAAAIRIDYVKHEVTFARSGDGLYTSRAIPLKVRVLDGKAVAIASLDGAAARFVLDTGNNVGFDLYKNWADSHGFPGKRRSVEMRGVFSAGTQPTVVTLFRLARAELGPITTVDRVSYITDPPVPPIIAGLVGNDAFSRCTAIVFDVEKRTVWFEPPCNRAVPEQKASWYLVKSESTTFKGRPWVVGTLVPGGSAERSGVKSGDRLLEIGGKPAVLDTQTFEALTEQPAGTKVPILVERNGERLKLTLELVKLLGS